MPHKVAILKHLDDITDEGREVGACNTLFIRTDPATGKRIFTGTNTDVVGIRDAFYQNISNADHSFHNRPGLIVGGGGAARSAVYALRKWMKATSIYIVNRDPAEVAAVVDECKARGFGHDLIHVETVEQAQALEGPGAVVACVPNFPPKTDKEIEARAVLEALLNKEHKGALLEMCYHPSPWTEIAEVAKEAGWEVILGTEAMIYQGLEQVCVCLSVISEQQALLPRICTLPPDATQRLTSLPLHRINTGPARLCPSCRWRRSRR